MALIIKQRRIETDSWQLLKPAADGSAPPVPPAGDVIVPLALWLEQRDALLSRAGAARRVARQRRGAGAIADDLKNFGVVAVNFRAVRRRPRLFARRGCCANATAGAASCAPIGDVLRDQLFYLSRCGFDAFDLRADQDLQAALAAFDDFSDAYQASVDRPLPLFRRRFIASPDGMEWS